MAWANDDEEDDKNALLDSLGGTRGPSGQLTSTTMPVPDPNKPPAPVAPPAAAPAVDAAPWAKGQIMGGAREGADFARLGGGFGSADTDSVKHTFGRIAQNFEHTPAGLQALVADAEFKKLFPNAKITKNDWLDFGGQFDPHTGTNINKIDVIHAFDPAMGQGNNKNWQWLTEEEAMQGGDAAAARQAMGQGPSLAQTALQQAIAGEDKTSRDQLGDQINALIAGQDPLDEEALLAQLQV